MHLDAVNIHHDRFPTREHYPFSLDVMQQTDTIPFTSPVTCFTGENGTGKSTLLRAIAIKCGIYIWGDTWSPRVTPNPYEQRMPEAISVSWRDGSVPGSYFDPQNFRAYTKLIDEWAVADPTTLTHYGGSSLVVNGAALGLLVNVGQRRPMLLSRRPFEHKQDTRPAPYRPLESSNAGKMASTERTP